MSNTTSTGTPVVNGGLGFVGALTITFIVLKLIHAIDWSWGWVLSPMWISASLIALGGIGVVALAIVSARREERRRAE